MTIARSTIIAKDWDEHRVAESDPLHSVARAGYATEWTGDIEATGSCFLLIAYTGGNPSDPMTLVGAFSGYEQVRATIDGRSGSFVLATTGEHREATVHAQVSIVPESGTGELAGIRGAGHYTSTGTQFTVELDYELA